MFLLPSFSNKVRQCTLKTVPPVQEHPFYPAGQDQGEHAPPLNPSSCVVLTGLGLWDLTCTLSSGTQCRLRQTLAKASAFCARPSKGYIGDRFGDSVGRGPLSALSSPASLRKLYKTWFLLHLSSVPAPVTTTTCNDLHWLHAYRQIKQPARSIAEVVRRSRTSTQRA